MKLIIIPIAILETLIMLAIFEYFDIHRYKRKLQYLFGSEERRKRQVQTNSKRIIEFDDWKERS